MKKGFTIIELLMVVIIIGILATIAVPQFNKAIEKTKVGKAKNVLMNVYKAASIFRQDVDGGNSNYNGGSSFGITTANDIIELGLKTVTAGTNGVGTDPQNDWSYQVNGIGTNTINITATRVSGNFAGCKISINENQTISQAGTCVK